MEFVRTQQPSVQPGLEFSLSVEVEDESGAGLISSSSLSRFSADLSLEIEDGQELSEIVIEQEGRGAIFPAIIKNIQGKRIGKQLTIVSGTSESTILRLYCKTTEGELGPFTVPIPPHKSFKIADKLIHTPKASEEIGRLLNIYETEEESDAIFRLLGDIDRWIQISDHFQILNSAARSSEHIKDELNPRATASFVGEQIINPEGESPYDINSWTELNQALSVCDNLKYIPSINDYYVIERVVESIHREGEFDLLWRIEKKLELGRNYWKGLLWDEQMCVIFAKCLIEGKFAHARDIIRNWMGPLIETDSIENEVSSIKKSEQQDKKEAWETFIRKTATISDRDLIYSSCNYFKIVEIKGSGDRMSLYLKKELHKAHSELAKSIGLSKQSTVAECEYYLSVGHEERKSGNFELAENHFKKALSVSATEEVNEDSERITNPEWIVFWQYKTRAEKALENDDYKKARRKISNGREVLEALTDVYSEENKQYCLTRLKAQEYEIEGDTALQNHQLDTARQSYGRAIGEYNKIDENDSLMYLNRRRGLIKASLAEQRGEFSSAKNAHKQVADQSDTRDFELFNQSRAKICEAKQALIEDERDRAEDLIEPYPDVDNVVGVEAQHLELVLDVLDTYQNGNVSRVADVFDELDELPDFDQVTDEFPFEYGHEYRPALANILAAQRLQRLGVDRNLLDELVEVSLREVMAPEQAKQTIEELGIADIGLRQQWKIKYPIHIVRRFQEIQTDEVGAGSNYSDQGLALLRLLEQSLDFVADYYGQLEFGANWNQRLANNDENHVSLQGLRDFLNTEAVEDCVWIDSVRELIDEPLIGGEDVIDARNMLGHDRKSYLSKEEYLEVKGRVEDIFTRISSEIPILGSVKSQQQLGFYILDIHWENVQKLCHLPIQATLNQESLYYLPPNAIENEVVAQVESDEIIECSSDRVSNNLDEYANYSDNE